MYLIEKLAKISIVKIIKWWIARYGRWNYLIWNKNWIWFFSI